ncbi:hypothetical protein ACWDKQ_31665 [Saccharopolyspora sp. NPDC000995]
MSGPGAEVSSVITAMPTGTTIPAAAATNTNGRETSFDSSAASALIARPGRR